MKRYMTLLQAVFIVRLLPAWFGNVGKRLIKAPKAFLNDTGLLAYLSGINADHLLREPGKAGAVVENFVMQELQKQISWNEISLNLFYYRTAGGREVDFILETMDGRIVGVEVKSASTVEANDFKGLRDLAETLGDRFHRGVILYLGPTTIPFAKNLHAIPLRALWSCPPK
jgi:predicted AAA+ superfamily ATPase